MVDVPQGRTALLFIERTTYRLLNHMWGAESPAPNQEIIHACACQDGKMGQHEDDAPAFSPPIIGNRPSQRVTHDLREFHIDHSSCLSDQTHFREPSIRWLIGA